MMSGNEHKLNLIYFENENDLYSFLHKYIFDSIGDFINYNFYFKNNEEKIEIINFVFNCSDVKKIIENKEKIIQKIKKTCEVNPAINFGQSEESIFVKKEDLFLFLEDKKEEIIHKIIKKLNKDKRINLFYIKEVNKAQWKFIK